MQQLELHFKGVRPEQNDADCVVSSDRALYATQLFGPLNKDRFKPGQVAQKAGGMRLAGVAEQVKNTVGRGSKTMSMHEARQILWDKGGGVLGGDYQGARFVINCFLPLSLTTYYCISFWHMKEMAGFSVFCRLFESKPSCTYFLTEESGCSIVYPDQGFVPAILTNHVQCQCNLIAHKVLILAS